MNALSQNLADQELARGLTESILSKERGEDWDNLAIRLQNKIIHELEEEACALEDRVEEGENEDYMRPTDLEFLKLFEKEAHAHEGSLTDALINIVIDDKTIGSSKFQEYLEMPEIKSISPSRFVKELRTAIQSLNVPVVETLLKYSLEDTTCCGFRLQYELPTDNIPDISEKQYLDWWHINDLIGKWCRLHCDEFTKRQNKME